MRLSTLLKQWKQNARVTAFLQGIDDQVALYKLDPNLPEITQIREDAREIVATGNDQIVLGWLDPNQWVNLNTSNATVDIGERTFGYVLELSTIIEYYAPGIKQNVVRIVCEGSGTKLYTSMDPEAKPVARCAGGSINPERLADPGNRYGVAFHLVEYYTGVELNWRDHIGRTSRVTLVKDSDGTWQVHIKTLVRS